MAITYCIHSPADKSALAVKLQGNASHQGFTLIELSIVLVIIGLIVGGVLVGQNLIAAGEVRAQITQIEKYNTAANTFRGKYGYLPGDIPNPTAGQFGFVQRGAVAGEGDGNGILQAVSSAACNNTGCLSGTFEGAGEVVMFWVDLSTIGLIDGGFNTATPATIPSADITGTNINLYLPQAKIGRGNYVYVWSSTYWSAGTGFVSLGVNYFGLSAANNIPASSNQGKMTSTANIPVAQAYAIDTKIDDGMPQSGNVMAWFLNGDQKWVDGTNACCTLNEPLPTTTAITGSSTTCYDNGHVANATQNYSMEINSGAGANCALSFKMQ